MVSVFGVKKNLVGADGSLSSITSFLGSYQVCHNLCLSAIALLGLLGVAVVGMPLLFLTKVAVPFWSAAVILLFLTLLVYARKRCVSGKLLIFNSGLVVAGVPFRQVQQLSLIFWSIGGVLVSLSIILFLTDRLIRWRVRVHGKT